MIAALAGGVGAARLLRGLARVVPPDEVTAVVNTGDDIVLHGLHISPDLDTVPYTLGGPQRRRARVGTAPARPGRPWTPWSAWAARPGSGSATATWPPTSTGPSASPQGATLSAVTAEIAARSASACGCCP